MYDHACSATLRWGRRRRRQQILRAVPSGTTHIGALASGFGVPAKRTPTELERLKAEVLVA